MTTLPIAEWCPDRPDLSETTSVAYNVVPLTPDSYGPLLAPVEYSSNALEATCIGMGFAEDTDGDNHVFAGTVAHLEILSTGSVAWSDVSGATYAAAAGESWRFAQFNNLMIATDFTDPIQSYNMIAGGTFGDLTPGPFDSNVVAAPNARYLAVAKTFLILANTYDTVGGTNPARVWWSPSGAPAGISDGTDTGWPVPGNTYAQQTQSDYNDLIGPQGEITGLAPNLSGCDCAVFFQRGVFNMFYAGPPDVFNFYPAANVRGSYAPNSIVPLGTVVFYRGEDGFYVYDGNSSTPIGANKVDKWFAGIVDPTAPNLVIGAPDIQNKAIVWIFRSIYAPTASPDQALIYRWDIQRWAPGVITTQWIGRGPAPTASSTPIVAAGQLFLAVIDVNAYLAFFTGTPLPAQAGTQVVEMSAPDRTFVNHARPLMNVSLGAGPILLENSKTMLLESGYPILTEAAGTTLTIAVSARMNYYDTEVFGPEVAPDAMGDCPQAADGRFHRGRISVSGAWSQMYGIEAQGNKAGRR